MGMISYFWQADQQQIDEFSRLPVSEAEDKAGLLFHEELEEKNECDIDKAWGGLNYIFCGLDQSGDLPGGFILGGNILGRTDLEPGENVDFDGMSAFRWYTIDQVAEISRFLNSWDGNKLKAKYDPNKMDEENIYPACFTNDPEGMFDYLLENLEFLRSFFQSVADLKGYVVTSIG